MQSWSKIIESIYQNVQLFTINAINGSKVPFLRKDHAF